MLEHTPLPWIASHRAIRSVERVKPIATANNPKDAEFIVRACNRYASLVEALVNLLNTAELNADTLEPKTVVVISRAKELYREVRLLR